MFDESCIAFLLVVTRISGALLFNPFLGRRSVPSTVKIGLALAVAAGIMPSLETEQLKITSVAVFTIIVVKELAVGYATGLVMQLVMSLASVAGEEIDLQLGLGMGKIYDPQSGTSTALTGTFYNLYFMLIFFMSDGHLTLIRLISESCALFPVGSEFINPKAGGNITLIFGDVLILALKLAMPVIAVELITEAGLGFLMRSVPGINVFAVGLQVKLAVGLAVVATALPAASKVLDTSLAYMFGKINDSIYAILSSG